jgi:hypothetical protein
LDQIPQQHMAVSKALRHGRDCIVKPGEVVHLIHVGTAFNGSIAHRNAPALADVSVQFERDVFGASGTAGQAVDIENQAPACGKLVPAANVEQGTNPTSVFAADLPF